MSPRGRRRLRKAFGFETKDADVRVIRHKGKTRIIRIVGPRIWARKNYLEHRMLNFLYPEHSIEPVGVSHTGGWRWWKRRWGMVSEIVRGRSRNYKEFLKWYYAQHGHVKPEESEIEGVRDHHNFARTEGVEVASRIARETGIRVSTHGANVMDVEGRPVFTEINHITPRELSQAILHLPKERKRRRLMKMFDEWYAIRHSTDMMHEA